jgi:hypothetical protein
MENMCENKHSQQFLRRISWSCVSAECVTIWTFSRSSNCYIFITITAIFACNTFLEPGFCFWGTFCNDNMPSDVNPYIHLSYCSTKRMTPEEEIFSHQYTHTFMSFEVCHGSHIILTVEAQWSYMDTQYTC